MNRILMLFALYGVSAMSVYGQSVVDTLSLKETYSALYSSYPTVEKRGFDRQIREFNQQVNSSLLYPDLNLSGSASYQSDVTEVPFAAPGSTPPSFSKEHFKLSLGLTQPIYDGGRVKALNRLEVSKEMVSQTELEVELNRLRAQVDQVFFSLMLMQKQKRIQELLKEEIIRQLDLVSAKVKNGILLPGNEWALQAEILKIDQQLAHTQSVIAGGYRMLEELTGLQLPHTTPLKVDISRANRETQEVERPEYDLFRAGIMVLQDQLEVMEAEKKPTLSAFATSAYSRPGLDAFSDKLEFWWMIGIKAQWNFRNWKNSSTKQKVLAIRQKALKADSDAFTRQLNAQLGELEARIDALERQLELDQEILVLREKVSAEKKSLLDQGAITSTEWFTELHAEHRARLNLELHQIELLKAKTELITKKGISWY